MSSSSARMGERAGESNEPTSRKRTGHVSILFDRCRGRPRLGGQRATGRGGRRTHQSGLHRRANDSQRPFPGHAESAGRDAGISGHAANAAWLRVHRHELRRLLRVGHQRLRVVRDAPVHQRKQVRPEHQLCARHRHHRIVGSSRLGNVRQNGAYGLRSRRHDDDVHQVSDGLRHACLQVHRRGEQTENLLLDADSDPVRQRRPGRRIQDEPCGRGDHGRLPEIQSPDHRHVHGVYRAQRVLHQPARQGLGRRAHERGWNDGNRPACVRGDHGRRRGCPPRRR